MRSFYALFFSLTVSIQSSFACECPLIATIDKLSFENYHVIFCGIVDSVKKNKAYFSIEKLFKGNSKKNISVFFDDSTDCQMAFNNSERWLIYAQYKKYAELTVNICSRSRREILDNDFYETSLLSNFKYDIQYLEKKLGIKKTINEQTESEKYDRILLHPSRRSVIILIIISVVGMLAVYLFIRKYL